MDPRISGARLSEPRAGTAGQRLQGRPEAFWRHNKTPTVQWHKDLFCGLSIITTSLPWPIPTIQPVCIAWPNHAMKELRRVIRNSTIRQVDLMVGRMADRIQDVMRPGSASFARSRMAASDEGQASRPSDQIHARSPDQGSHRSWLS